MPVLVDSNAVSELIRKASNPAVTARTADHALEDEFLPAIGEAELRCGAAIPPTVRRRASLISDIERMLLNAFEDRVPPFDSEAARTRADIAPMRRSAGRSVQPSDRQVAEIVPSRDTAVAARRVRDFENLAIAVVDPWSVA